MSSAPVEWIVGTSSAVTATALVGMVGAIRRFFRQHDWLMRTVKENTEVLRQQGAAIEQQGNAIEVLLKRRR